MTLAPFSLQMGANQALTIRYCVIMVGSHWSKKRSAHNNIINGAIEALNASEFGDYIWPNLKALGYRPDDVRSEIDDF